MRDVVIASYVRSAQSRCRPNDPGRDWLFNIRTDDLLAKLLPEAIDRAGLEAKDVDDFVMGCAQAVGENFTLGGRGPHLLANLDKRTSCKQIDEQCGSTMAALQMGFMEIAQGFADVVLCGGMEHMGRIPMGGDGKIELNLRLFSDPSLLHWDFMTAMNMGLTAEKVAAMGYTREEMDAWGARSHQLAYKAQQEGFFAGEILPVDVLQADGTIKTVDTDQAVRSDATEEDMAKLRPAFKKNGTIHAGTSSPLNAGASALVLMDRETAEAKGVKPLARIVSIGFAGVEPNIMGTGPVPSTLRALKAAGLEASDIDFLGNQRSLRSGCPVRNQGTGYRSGQGQRQGRWYCHRTPAGCHRRQAGGNARAYSPAGGWPLWLRHHVRGCWSGCCHDHRKRNELRSLQ